jgi:acyl-coenzyme A thioesterase PaaI-like protein
VKHDILIAPGPFGGPHQRRSLQRHPHGDDAAERIAIGEAWSRIAFSAAALRPGGTHSGPALMALIDMCMYAAVLGATGEDPRPLTTNVAVTFLRRAPACDLIARCKLLSRDSDFAVGSIVVYPEGNETEIVCTSTCTYALPPRASKER